MNLKIKITSFVLLTTLGACARTANVSQVKTVTPLELRLKRKVVEPKRSAFYKKAFNNATIFIEKTIPERMLAPWDRDNSTYIEARENKKILGFLRDFTGPVSPKEECACNPFSVTLVFDTEYNFKDLLYTKPLEKYGHQPLTSAEQKKLVQLLLEPKKALQKIRSVEEIVDALSGATKAEYKNAVVPQAGLITARLWHLIKATERILQGAPVARDQMMLSELLSKKLSSKKNIDALIQFFPKAETLRVRKQTYRLIAHFYFKDFNAPNFATEDFLLNATLPDKTETYELYDICYRFVQEGRNIEWVKKCLNRVKKTRLLGEEDTARLAGMYWAQRGDHKRAYRYLKTVLDEIPPEVDPQLHVNFIRAALARKKTKEACMAAKTLYALAPLFSDSNKMLKSCGDANKINAIVKEIHRIQKDILLETDLHTSEPVPEILVQGESFDDIPLPLLGSGKHTVLLFFATWCPHCRNEFPRIKAFVDGLKKDPLLADNVRVLAVRTAVEREKQSFEDFLREFKPNFRIYTDATMSLAFSKFARSQSIGAGLPTLVVLDRGGHLRWVMPTGTYRDTVRDLDWVLRELVERS